MCGANLVPVNFPAFPVRLAAQRTTLIRRGSPTPNAPHAGITSVIPTWMNSEREFLCYSGSEARPEIRLRMKRDHAMLPHRVAAVSCLAHRSLTHSACIWHIAGAGRNLIRLYPSSTSLTHPLCYIVHHIIHPQSLRARTSTLSRSTGTRYSVVGTRLRDRPALIASVTVAVTVRQQSQQL